jgi:hypothetical protein
VVVEDDVAIFLMCLRFITSEMNADGTLPTRRFQALWTSLHECNDVSRAWNCHRFKAIRDHLSNLGLLEWADNTYTKSGNGTGRACKWKASNELLALLIPKTQEGEKERTSFVATSAASDLGEPVSDPNTEGEGRGRTSFVATSAATGSRSGWEMVIPQLVMANGPVPEWVGYSIETFRDLTDEENEQLATAWVVVA